MKISSFLKNKIFLRSVFVLLLLGLVAVAFSYPFRKTETKKIRIENKERTAAIKKNIDQGDKLFDKGAYADSYFYYKKATQLCKPIDHYADDYVYSYLSIANLQQNMSNYIACEESIAMVLPHLKKTSKPKFTYNTYTLLAYNYYFTYDDDNALFYHKKALKLATSPYKKAVILCDISNIYLNQKKYKKVIDILEPLAKRKIKHETDSIKTANAYAILLENLGYCYYEVGDPRALDCLKKSSAIKLKLNEDYELVSSYNNLALYYSKTNPALSKLYAEKEYQSACKANSATFKANSLSSLITKSEGKELKKYALSYIKIIDSLTIARRKSKNQFSTIKYSSNQNKEENFQLKAQKAENELQLERQKKRNIVSYIVMFSTTMISLLVFVHLLSKSRKEKNDAILQSEIRISKKLHDELAQDVYQTLKFSAHTDLKQEENKDQLLNSLNAIYAKARNISKENSSIVTDENYSTVLKEMISGFKTADLNIILNGFDQISWNEIEKGKKIILYRILQELFGNMKKHSQATLVSLNFKDIEKKITINYSDNGVGAYNRSLILKNGLQNVESRIKTINGNIIFDSNSKTGFKLSFNFPK
ncbi:tetratricopeptide repeat-containing sensor histidine kinase [Flavobacterium sp. T12S277]|uniref:tetratricopeptide repeat-containing sensor histidine kinase n=1 Tax=Flavobacterium sp. T12S277 TaxID=3402752 RepID=UPI003ADC66A4